MPGAADRVVNDQPLAERASVMGAGGADRQDFSAPASQQHRLVPDLTDKHRAIGEIILRNTVRQIRLVQARLCHPILPAAYVAASTLSRPGESSHFAEAIPALAKQHLASVVPRAARIPTPQSD